MRRARSKAARRASICRSSGRADLPTLNGCCRALLRGTIGDLLRSQMIPPNACVRITRRPLYATIAPRYCSHKGDTMRWLILLPILVVALLLVTFGVQNTQLVTVRFLSFEARDLSASIVIILSAIGGALLAGMLGVWNSIQHGLRGRRDLKQRTQLEQRIAELERQLAATKAAAPKEPVAVSAASAASAASAEKK